MKPLVIVESPTKAKTIGSFLGKSYNVLASYGHVRDLPNSAKEIPLAFKKEKWSRLGINVEKNFEPLYIIPEEKKKRVKELKDALKDATEVLLATDEDREGESISWHLLEVLKPKIPVKRLVFHEITKKAIAESLESPRDIDENLVRAQETRRTIDRLYGYSVSPLLWKKLAPRLSAGRVQSVALRLLVEREIERIAFRESNFWDLSAKFKKGSDVFDAVLTHINDKRVATGKDFDPKTGKLISDAIHLDEAAVNKLLGAIKNKDAKVKSVETKPFTQKPAPPFVTSTLQQEGSRKLGFSARRTMQIAQNLYENGFITYMRTDSTSLSSEAIEGARNLIESEFGRDFLPSSPREYKTKVKNAQEAHEAIRPAGSSFASPSEVKSKLGLEAFRLYELIWKRTLACQMKDAEGTRVSVSIGLDNTNFRASGKTISFPGFLRAYVEGSDDPEAELGDMEKILPPLKEGEDVDIESLSPVSHTTQPPARFTEGSLIKELERLGIGRPSTWATIVDVVLSRDYAFKKGTALVPTFLAMGVVRLLKDHFTNLLDYEFTASLEDDLDSISRGEKDYLDYLNKFYNGNGHPGLKTLVTKGEEEIDPRVVCGLPLGKKEDGTLVEVRIGKYGTFLSDGTNRVSLPEDMAPDELTIEKAIITLADAAKGPTALGEHPELKKPIFVKKGRFGPYIQLGADDDEEKRNCSFINPITPENVTLEDAVALLSLPKTLGKHPETNEDIVVANGRFGPYVKSGKDTRSIPSDINPLTLDFEGALKILAMEKRRGRASAPATLKELGEHPDSKLKLVVKSGRYGPYVTDGTLNASIPKGQDPESLTIEEAVTLLAARAENAPVKKKRAKKKA
jgi:DNA topoisomerase-1